MKDKNINKFRNGIFSLIASAMLGSTLSCTDKIGDAEINIIQGSPDTVSTAAVALGMLKGSMLKIHDTEEHQYQYQFNLHIDAYAGYLTVANNLEGRIPSTYFINPSFESGPLSSLLTVANYVVPVIRSAERFERPDLAAIANIIFCYSVAECTDVYGPMPYLDYRTLKSEPPLTFNSVEEIYTDLFLQLRSASETLKDVQISSEDKITLSKMDIIGNGDFTTWRKFANTLRLRLAMRIVKANPSKAKMEAEDAVKEGVLEGSENNVTLNNYYYRNLYVISEQWNDTRLGASLGNILERLGHPYLDKYFKSQSLSQNSKGEDVSLPNGRTKMGIRPGTSVSSKQGTNPFASYSSMTSDISSMPIVFMKVCEAYFLRSEGALRGWAMGGSAESMYTNGIKYSFDKEGLGDSKAMNAYYAKVVENLPYIDLYNSETYNDPKGLVNINSKWDKNASNEENLERIITQKYIANFPLSLEAWSEFRRTGYPHLIPVSYDGGDYSIPDGGYIRRMIFQRTGNMNVADVERTGVPALGGPDEQNTRLWWDVDAPNF